MVYHGDTGFVEQHKAEIKLDRHSFDRMDIRLIPASDDHTDIVIPDLSRNKRIKDARSLGMLWCLTIHYAKLRTQTSGLEQNVQGTRTYSELLALSRHIKGILSSSYGYEAKQTLIR